MPEQFVCDACQERQTWDLRCTPTASDLTLWCVYCCHCTEHDVSDVPGQVIFPWRLLHQSESRARRHR
jgi:hypothetical protein